VPDTVDFGGPDTILNQAFVLRLWQEMLIVPEAFGLEAPVTWGPVVERKVRESVAEAAGFKPPYGGTMVSRS